MHFRFSIFLLVIFLWQCSAPKPVQKEGDPTQVEMEKNQPAWVKQRPVSATHYIGIGIASKNSFPTTYSLEAQRNALNELASQIEVKITSNSMLFSFENKEGFSDQFSEFIQVKTNQDLEGYEQVAAYEDMYNYYVYYALSKEVYETQKQQKIQAAIDLSKGMVLKAEKLLQENRQREAFIQFFAAIEPLNPFLGEPLKTTVHEQEVYLGNYILERISDISNSWKIQAKNHRVNSFWGGSILSEDLCFEVGFKEKEKLKDIPVNFTYSEGIIRPRNGKSNGAGQVFTEIRKITSSTAIQKVSAEIDYETLIGNTISSFRLKKWILEKVVVPKDVIELRISAPKIKVSVTGKNSELLNRVQASFENQLTQKGFAVVNTTNNANLEALITIDYKSLGEVYDLQQVILNLEILIKKTQTHGVIYQDQIPHIKGVAKTQQMAISQAFEKAINELEQKVAPRFYRLYAH